MRTAVEDGDLPLDGHRAVLRLHQKTRVLAPLVQHGGRHGVHVAAELGEGFQLAVLRLVDLQRTGHPLHRLDLGVAADARDGDAHVDGRAVALIEKVGIEENLTVRDGDDVGRNIG